MKTKTCEKNKKNIGRKILIISIVSAAILAVLGIFACNKFKTGTGLNIADKTYNGEKAMGTVNGEPFYQFDINVYAMELRAAVAGHYGRKYNLSGMGAGFWETPYEGQTPADFLQKQALNELVKSMVLIQEARKRGIATPAVYHDLETEREAWNTPTDEIVYGPRSLGPAEYNSYRISRIKDELMTNLLLGELAPTPEQLKASFNSLDDGLKTARLIITGVRFFWDEDAGSRGAIQSRLRQGIKNGEEPELLVKRLSDTIQGLSQEEMDFNSRYVSKEDPYDQELTYILEDAAIGDFVPGPQDRPELYYIIKKEGGHIMQFEEAPGLGMNKWINDQFEIFLDKKIKAAKITLFD